MFQLNGSLIAGAQRLKKDDLPIWLEDTLHFVHPFLQFISPGFRMPNDEIRDAPTREDKICKMILNWQLTMIRYIHIPIGESACDKSFTTNAQHFRRHVKRSNESYTRSEHPCMPSRPSAEIEDLKPIHVDNFINCARNISLIILA